MPADTQLRDEVLRHLRDPRYAVFPVLDAARSEGIGAGLEAAGLACERLRRPSGDAALDRLAPLLADPYRDPEREAAALGEAAAIRADDVAGAIAERMRAALEAGDATGGGLLAPETPGDVPRDAAFDARAETLAALARPGSGLVAWVCPASVGAAALRAHLRRVARVMVPSAHLGEEDGPLPPATGSGAGEADVPASRDGEGPAVLRHEDGDVLAEVLPVLDDAQVATFLGPAVGLLFDAPSHPRETGTTYAWPTHPFDLPDANAPPRAWDGPIHLSSAQMDEVAELHLQGSRVRVGRYLRTVDPACAEMDEVALAARVRTYEASGDRMGLCTERGHMKWGYLMAVSDGGIDAPETRRFFDASEAAPDNRVDAVMDRLDAAWDAARPAG